MVFGEIVTEGDLQVNMCFGCAVCQCLLWCSLSFLLSPHLLVSHLFLSSSSPLSFVVRIVRYMRHTSVDSDHCARIRFN